MPSGALTSDKTVIVRASKTAYGVLWVPLLLLISLFLYIGIRGALGNTILVAVVLFALGLLCTVFLRRLQLRLSSSALSYRGAIRSSSISLADVSAIHVGLVGRERVNHELPKGPGIILRVETATDSQRSPISVSAKLFDRHELQQLFSALQGRGISLHLDKIAARIFRGS